MPSLEHSSRIRLVSAVLAFALGACLVAGPIAPSAAAPAGIIPNPCNLPGASTVCDAVTGTVGKVASEAGAYVMRGVTEWVTDAAVWVTGKVGQIVENTTTPDLTAGWFQGQYGAMLGVAGALAVLMLMLAVIQAVMRQDVAMLVRAAFGYLPMAFILAGVAVAAAGLLVAITDDISASVVTGLGTDQSTNLLQSIGDAYKNALDDTSGIPLFGVFLGAIVLAIGAFVLWLELIIRDAAIYVCVFFLPLTFVAMIWPATSRWARRLIELLVAIILSKFVIVAILTLSTAALANTTIATGEGHTFEQMLAGAALLVLAAWSPFALLRLIPMMELAAASVASQRSSMSAAAGSAGIHSPASYMRTAMDRGSRSSTSPAYPATGGTVYAGDRQHTGGSDRTSGGGHGSSDRTSTRAATSSGSTTTVSGGTVTATPGPRSGPTRASDSSPPARPPESASPVTDDPSPPRRKPDRRPPSRGGDE